MKRIDSYFKKRTFEEASTSNLESLILEDNIGQEPYVVDSSPENEEFDPSSLERDPRLRKSIFDFPVEQRDAIRRAYVKLGPYQPIPPRTSMYLGQNAFIVEGFRNWKKVKDGKNCAFLNHHVDKVIEKQSSKKVASNRLKVQVSIDAIKWCALQGIAFRSRDERLESINRRKFIQLIKHTTHYNEAVDAVAWKDVPRNATYTSPEIQKQILSLLTSKVQHSIVNEIGNAKFCILVDESQDSSKREQMAIVIRFVDKEGYIREKFFDSVHVEDTKSLILKKEIHRVLSQHNLSIQNIRGQ